MYRLVDGKLIPIERTGKTICLKDKSHLIVKQLQGTRVLVINSLADECLVLSSNQWCDGTNVDISLMRYLSDAIEPGRVDERVSERESEISFAIILSYACNLKCRYCYQQNSKTLDKKMISDERLDYILDTICDYRDLYPEKTINIELFGGEPLLCENEKQIGKILDFCAQNGFSLGITTNGVNLDYYAKQFVIYRGVGISIYTTIDSLANNCATRSNLTEYSEIASGSRLLKSVRALVENGVYVGVAANIDKHNIEELPLMLEYYEKEGYFDNEYFSFSIGRVDDRFFETGYKDILTGTDILLALENVNVNKGNNLYATFMKATYGLCLKINKNYNQCEAKNIRNYCWAVGPWESVFYVDPTLNTYRCTYTVGREEYSTGKFNLESIKNNTKRNRTYMENPKCRNCNIAGYCGGGCEVSASIDFSKQCENEKKEFEDFLERFFLPQLEKIVLQRGCEDVY